MDPGSGQAPRRRKRRAAFPERERRLLELGRNGHGKITVSLGEQSVGQFSGFAKRKPCRQARPSRPAVVDQYDIAPRDGNACAAVAVGGSIWAEMQSGKVSASSGPLDLDDRLAVIRAIGMIKRIDGTRDLGEPHRLAMFRIGVLGDSRIAGTENLFEDQDVARLEVEDAVAARWLAFSRASPPACRGLALHDRKRSPAD